MHTRKRIRNGVSMALFILFAIGTSALAQYHQIGEPGQGVSQKPWCGY